MNKWMCALLIAGASALAVIGPSAAQSSEEGLVKVPFAFIAGDKQMPAGTYIVSGQTRDWTRVRIASVDGKSVAIVRAKTASLKPVPGIEPRLWFTLYYGHYFLQKLAMPFLDVREVPLTKTEAQQTLARLNLMPAEETGDTIR